MQSRTHHKRRVSNEFNHPENTESSSEAMGRQSTSPVSPRDNSNMTTHDTSGQVGTTSSRPRNDRQFSIEELEAEYPRLVRVLARMPLAPIDFASVWAPGFYEPVPEQVGEPTPRRERTGPIFVYHPPHDLHDHPHRHVTVYGGIFLNGVPNNVGFEPIDMTETIRRVLIPTDTEENDSCAICREAYDTGKHKPVKMPDCIHVLGEACILEWLNQNQNNMTCPLCRGKISIVPLARHT